MWEVYGIALPSLIDDYNSTGDRPAIAALIAEEQPRWHEVAASEAQWGDVTVFRIGKWPLHVGVVAGTDPVKILHVERGIDTCLEPLTSPALQRRLVGVYRHPARLWGPTSPAKAW
jgi:hypothetical protein